MWKNQFGENKIIRADKMRALDEIWNDLWSKMKQSIYTQIEESPFEEINWNLSIYGLLLLLPWFLLH